MTYFLGHVHFNTISIVYFLQTLGGRSRRGAWGTRGAWALTSFWVKKEMTEGRKASQGQVNQNQAPNLAQCLDPPLKPACLQKNSHRQMLFIWVFSSDGHYGLIESLRG